MTTTKQPMAAVLAKIMGEVGRVEKKGQISGSVSYKFARDTDVLEAVTPKMAEAGIVLVPEHQELLSMEPTLSGRQIIANIKTGWHVTDGTDSIRFETFGQGADSGDKALPKAQSNARKYAFFMLYHIVTGDDPDQHASDGESDGRTYAPRRANRPEAQPQSTPASAQTYETRGQLQEAIAKAAVSRGLTFAHIEETAKGLGIERGNATLEQLMVLLVAVERGDEQPAEPEPVAAA